MEDASFLFPVLGGILLLAGFLIWQRYQTGLHAIQINVPSYREVLSQLQKELSRARRSKRRLSVVVIRMATRFRDTKTFTDEHLQGVSHEFLLCGPIFSRALRDIDTVVYDVKNKQYVIVLPETTKTLAIQPIRRLNGMLSEGVASRLVIALSEFPCDGFCLEDLLSAGQRNMFPWASYARATSPAESYGGKSGSNLIRTQRSRSNDEETEKKQGIQGEGPTGSDQGGADAGQVGTFDWNTPHLDRGMEAADGQAGQDWAAGRTAAPSAEQ